MPRTTFRDAERTDLDALAAIETTAFASDRLSPRSLARFIAAHTADLRVALVDGAVAGYALVAFRAGSGVARLYSLAVDPSFRRLGLAAGLVADAEQAALRRGKRVLRLEVRADNAPAIRLYERLGFRPIGRVGAYYADGADALRHEKPLAGAAGRAADEEDRSPRDIDRRRAYGTADALAPTGGCLRPTADGAAPPVATETA